MGAQVFGGKITITGTATTITSLLGLSDKKYLGEIAIRSASTNGGTIYFGKSDVTTSANQLGFLTAGDAISVSITNALFNTNELYLIGTVPGDICYVLGVG